MVKRYLLFGAISGAVAIIDQVTKALVLHRIPLRKSITVIPGFFDITHVYNPGGAFGFLARHNSPLTHWLFLAAVFFALGLLIYFFHRTPKSAPFFALALSLIFGGAIGNLIDRLRIGKVVDFLDVYVGAYHWPTFNIADSAVTIGVGIFIFYIATKKAPI